ncbi:MAG TPA: hypothetical protein VGF13_08865, partial [Verrucomicrobiae bacterium]
MAASQNPERTEKPGADDPGPGAEFLLHEFEREWSFSLSNEESGDKRITFLWSLAAALIAGVGALGMSEKMKDAKDVDLILAFSCVATAMVFLFGGQTFVRVLRRNQTSDNHKRRLNR